MSSEGLDLVRRKAQELFPDSPRDQAYVLGLAAQESGFNPSAYNAQGDAYGLFQFAGDMRKAYGMDTNSPAQVQVDAGGDYLSQLYKKHHGDWDKVLAEHYMGAPRLARSLEGKTDAEVRSFFNSHLPKVKERAQGFLPGGRLDAQSRSWVASAASKAAELTPLETRDQLAETAAAAFGKDWLKPYTTQGSDGVDGPLGALAKFLMPSNEHGGAEVALGTLLSILPPLMEVKASRPVVEKVGAEIARHLPNPRRGYDAKNFDKEIEDTFFHLFPKAVKTESGVVKTVQRPGDIHASLRPEEGWTRGFLDRDSGEFLNREEGALALAEALRRLDGSAPRMERVLDAIRKFPEQAYSNEAASGELYDHLMEKLLKLTNRGQVR